MANGPHTNPLQVPDSLSSTNYHQTPLFPGHAVLTKQLESQISTFKEKSAKEGASAGSLTYEVHYRGDHAKFAEAAKVCGIKKACVLSLLCFDRNEKVEIFASDVNLIHVSILRAFVWK